MRRLRRALLIALLLAMVAGPTYASKAGEAPDEVGYDIGLAEMGQPVFERRCASCHGDAARGDGPVAPTLKVPPADLTRIAARRGGDFPDGEIARFIDGRFDFPAHGSRLMPVWGERLGEAIPESGLAEEVTRGKIATLLEYLKSLQRD
jgi:mono/diheme cytochrome c family protein